MKAVPYVDERVEAGDDGPCALVRFVDASVMFNASWGEPSALFPRPDGTRRRQLRVRILLSAAHRVRPFHLAQSIVLYFGTNEPLTSDDFGGVYSKHPDGVTLAWFLLDEPRFVLGGVGAEPPRKTTVRPGDTGLTKPKRR